MADSKTAQKTAQKTPGKLRTREPEPRKGGRVRLAPAGKTGPTPPAPSTAPAARAAEAKAQDKPRKTPAPGADSQES